MSTQISSATTTGTDGSKNADIYVKHNNINYHITGNDFLFTNRRTQDAIKKLVTDYLPNKYTPPGITITPNVALPPGRLNGGQNMYHNKYLKYKNKYTSLKKSSEI